MSVSVFLGLYNYWIVIFLMMTGFYIVISRGNLIRSIIGLNIFQTSVFLLYITMGKVRGGTAPIIPPSLAAAHDAGHGADASHAADAAHAAGADHAVEGVSGAVAGGGEAVAEVLEVASPIYSNPVPSVLMLTAIVVGIATTAVALSLIVRIREDYGTIEEDEILALDQKS